MVKANVFLSFALLVVSAITATAQQKFNANLSGAQQVPPVDSPATGVGIVTLNPAESQITATLTYTGLSSEAIGAHIHGAAPPGQNAPVLFNFTNVGGTSNTLTLTFSVTSQEVQLLRSNRLYFNVHSTNFPNGEIRGQIKLVYLNDDIDGDSRSDLTVLRPLPPTENATNVFVLNSLNLTTNVKRIPFVVDQSLFGDYAPDGRNDLNAIRIDPPTGALIHNIFNLNTPPQDPGFVRGVAWGNNNLGDIPVSADFDGDGTPDFSIFRKSNGSWWILQSSTNTQRIEYFGAQSDIPAVSDYDKDGKADLAIVREVGGQFVWFIRQSSNNVFRYIQWGLATDTVLNRYFWIDFDGDGAADPTIVRKVDNQRFIYALRSFDSSLLAINWGLASDRTKIADADGDGRSDVVAIRAVPNPSGDLIWFIRQSSTGELRALQWGLGTDVTVSAD